MFTGLIEAVCTVKSVQKTAQTLQLAVDLGKLANEVKIGDSIAISGICLTVTKLQNTTANFDVSSETLEKSTLSNCKPGLFVNVELAMKIGDRFGGHIVASHIDGTAIIKSINKQGQFANIKFTATPELLDQMVVKGSVAVDGVSLTIAEIHQNSFSVAVIPKTLEKTTLGKAKAGDTVNIETDIIVKTIKKQLEKILSQKEGLTINKLKKMGF